MIDEMYLHFTRTMGDYDTLVDSVVMKNDELHQVMVDSMNFERETKLNILDLGSGTGHGIKLILKKYPDSMITGVDFSKSAILDCKNKLKEYSNNIKFIEQDIIDLEFEDNKFDVIISAVTIHNITHSQKEILFKKIFSWLKPNGCFINGDFIEGENKEIDNHYREIYRQYMVKRMHGRELEVWLDHAFIQDMPMKLSSQFEILRRVGFKNMFLLWQFVNESVYVAKK